MRFSEFVQLNEIGPMPPTAGLGMGAPPMGGALGGLPPPGMGGMGGPGMPPPMPGGGLGGPPPMGGAPGAPGMPQAPPTEIKTKDVWSLLEKLLSGQAPADNKDSEEGKQPSKILRSV